MTALYNAKSVLDEAKQYLLKISTDQYSTLLHLLSRAFIGAHTPHYIEYFQCLTEQFKGDLNELDCASRKQDPELENDPVAAREAIHSIRRDLDRDSPDRPVTLACNKYLADDGQKFRVETNLTRELLYNIEHTMHHFAIIKIGLATCAPHIELPLDFGVAPSTIQHQRSCVQ